MASNADNSKLKNGFRCTGIHPFNDKAIPEEAYQPSTLYVQESTVTAAVAGNGTNYVNNKFGLFFFKYKRVNERYNHMGTMNKNNNDFRVQCFYEEYSFVTPYLCSISCSKHCEFTVRQV